MPRNKTLKIPSLRTGRRFHKPVGIDSRRKQLLLRQRRLPVHRQPVLRIYRQIGITSSQERPVFPHLCLVADAHITEHMRKIRFRVIQQLITELIAQYHHIFLLAHQRGETVAVKISRPADSEYLPFSRMIDPDAGTVILQKYVHQQLL